jgi:hypothetical protein
VRAGSGRPRAAAADPGRAAARRTRAGAAGRAIVEANEDGVAVALTGLHDETAEGAPEASIDTEDPDVWYVADAIPAGTTAAIALIEHRWAVGLKAAMQSTGGTLLAEEWIHPLDLEAVGL